MTARSELAAAIETATADTVSVYGYLAAVVAPPAVVVRRTETTPRTISGPSVLQHRMTVYIIVTATVIDDAEDSIEEIFMDIVGALPRGVRWSTLGAVDTYTIADSEYLGAELGVEWKEGS